jgi:bacterioferritin-associated ferredoxin
LAHSAPVAQEYFLLPELVISGGQADIDNHSQLCDLSTVASVPVALMIVCVCNRLSDLKIRGAIACGAESPDQVYAHNGVRKVCGTCQETIATMLQEHEPQERLQAAE